VESPLLAWDYPFSGQIGRRVFLIIAQCFNLPRAKPSPAGAKEASGLLPGQDPLGAASPARQCWASQRL